MSTHTYTPDLEWTIKEDCDKGNVLRPVKSEAEWLANSTLWKPAEKVVLTETLNSARITQITQNCTHVHLHLL